MPRKATKKTTGSKKQTIREFKAWLAGIAEFQPTDWCPTPEQWKLIKEKINNLSDIEYAAPNRDTVPSAVYMESPMAAPRQPQRRLPAPSLMQPNQEPIGLESGAIDPNAIMPLMQPAEASLPIPQIPNMHASPNVENISSTVKFSGKSYKTPTDMSGNGYKSPFT
jgi:hypothetical protein